MVGSMNGKIKTQMHYAIPYANWVGSNFQAVMELIKNIKICLQDIIGLNDIMEYEKSIGTSAKSHA